MASRNVFFISRGADLRCLLGGEVDSMRGSFFIINLFAQVIKNILS